MSQTPDMANCIDTSAATDGALSAFYSLNYHFGMLLGVDDFATEQAYHRGKMRLHNAWMQGDGVVWCFDVQVDKDHGEIKVTPGLALDSAGHELHLEGAACVNVGQWFLAHQSEFTPTAIANGFQFDAHVEARFKSCLTRQVPALSEPCDGAGGGGTAYSRVYETVDLRLVPGKAPARAADPYHRLRVLFGLAAPVLPDDQAVVDARSHILAQPSGDQPAAYLSALRVFAAQDGIALKPFQPPGDAAASLFPTADDNPVILADIAGITIERANANDPFQLTGGTPDVTVRPSHIATSTIQELLCGPLLADTGGGAADTGPRVLAAQTTVADSAVTLVFDKPLALESVTAGAFALTTFKAGAGWTDVSFTVDTSALPAVALKVTGAPLAADAFVRVIALGTGSKPILGTDLAPLAGAKGGPPAPPFDGIDFVFMKQRS